MLIRDDKANRTVAMRAVIPVRQLGDPEPGAQQTFNYLSSNNFERKHHDNNINPKTQIIHEPQ